MLRTCDENIQESITMFLIYVGRSKRKRSFFDEVSMERQNNSPPTEMRVMKAEEINSVISSKIVLKEH